LQNHGREREIIRIISLDSVLNIILQVNAAVVAAVPSAASYLQLKSVSVDNAAERSTTAWPSNAERESAQSIEKSFYG
jgi:hypothetical protein